MRIWNLFFRRKRPDFAHHIHTDKHGCRWVDTKYFGFGDLSPAKDDTGLVFPTAEEYLKQYGSEYPWREVWLRHGKTFTAPSRQQCLAIDAAGAHIPGNCYNNALRLALGMEGKIILPHRPKEVLYGEGIAVNPTGAYLHAWLVIDGQVYDPTWPDAYRASYFGMTFSVRQMHMFAELTGRVSLLQNWQQAEPGLTSFFKVA